MWWKLYKLEIYLKDNSLIYSCELATSFSKKEIKIITSTAFHLALSYAQLKTNKEEEFKKKINELDSKPYMMLEFYSINKDKINDLNKDVWIKINVIDNDKLILNSNTVEDLLS